MKILITGHYSEIFREQYCFNNSDSSIHEGCFNRMIELKKSFKKLDMDLIGQDSLNDADSYDAVIIWDHPKDKKMRQEINNISVPIYLIAEEAPIILPENFIDEFTKKYKRIFTWMNVLIDGKRYIKNYSLFPDLIASDRARKQDIPIAKKKGKVLIASLRPCKHKNSRYHLRKEIALWYKENYPQELDIYGRYWDRHYFAVEGIIGRILNSNKLNFIFNTKKYQKLYKGILKSKNYDLKGYLFQFCMENAEGYDGYVTEKIFDALICRNIPIYYPSFPNNVNMLIPKNVYINAIDFKSIEELNSHLNNLSFSAIEEYFYNAEIFLDNLPEELKPNYAADKIAKLIKLDLSGSEYI